jgi:hypothetical protein
MTSEQLRRRIDGAYFRDGSKCPRPGTHRARQVGSVVRCPGCSRACIVPGTNHDEPFRVVELYGAKG